MSDEIDSQEGSLFEKPGQVIVINPAIPIITKVASALAKEDDNGIHTVESVPEASQLVMTVAPCLVLLSGATKTDMINTSQFLVKNQQLIRKQQLKAILVTKVKDPGVLDQFTKLGINEVVSTDISEYSFGYKLKLHLKALKAMKLAKNEKDLELANKLNEAAGLNKAASDTRNSVQEAPFLEIGEDVWLIKGEKPKRVGMNWLIDMDGPDPRTGEWIEAGVDEKTGEKKWAFKASINKKDDDTGGPPKEGWVFTGNKPQSVGDPPKWRMVGKQPDLSYVKGKMKKGSKVSTNEKGGLIIAKDSAAAEENVKQNKLAAQMEEELKKLRKDTGKKPNEAENNQTIKSAEASKLEESESKALTTKAELKKEEEERQKKLELKMKARQARDPKKAKEEAAKQKEDAEEKFKLNIKKAKEKEEAEKQAAQLKKDENLSKAIEQKKQKEKEEAAEKKKLLLQKLKQQREGETGELKHEIGEKSSAGGVVNKTEQDEKNGKVKWDKGNKEKVGDVKKDLRHKLNLKKIKRVDDEEEDEGSVKNSKDKIRDNNGVKSEDETENFGGLKGLEGKKKKKKRAKLLDLKKPFGSLAMKPEEEGEEENEEEDIRKKLNLPKGKIKVKDEPEKNNGTVKSENSPKENLGNIKKDDKKPNPFGSVKQEENENTDPLVAKADKNKGRAWKPTTAKEVLEKAKERRSKKKIDLKKLKSDLEKHRKTEKPEKQKQGNTADGGGFSWTSLLVGTSDRLYEQINLKKITKWKVDFIVKKLRLKSIVILDMDEGFVVTESNSSFSVEQKIDEDLLKEDKSDGAWEKEFYGLRLVVEPLSPRNPISKDVQDLLGMWMNQFQSVLLERAREILKLTTEKAA